MSATSAVLAVSFQPREPKSNIEPPPSTARFAVQRIVPAAPSRKLTTVSVAALLCTVPLQIYRLRLAPGVAITDRPAAEPFAVKLARKETAVNLRQICATRANVRVIVEAALALLLAAFP